jgi:hypothetical protein
VARRRNRQLAIGPQGASAGLDPGTCQRASDDPHLRSIAAIEGYHIHATDGEIGHVVDMLIEEVDWSIRFLVVDTKNWWPGKRVLVSPRSAREVSWTDQTIDIDVNREAVRSSPGYDATAEVDRDYEQRFNSDYGNAVPASSVDPRSTASEL